MENRYLEELIAEVQERGGGIILSLLNKPQAVVLSIDRYNELVEGSKAEPEAVPVPPKPVNHVLVTGGAGYIGAHVVRELLKSGHMVTVLDSLVTGRRENVPSGAKFIEGDLSDVNLLRDVFAAGQFSHVVHMAASLEVEESVQFPVQYLQNNVINTEKLLSIMVEAGVRNIIFSSTAAVYGNGDGNPFKETDHAHPVSPYGYSKFLAEKLIKYYAKFAGINAVVFRYFNACGSDFDGAIIDGHKHSHLIPIVLEVARGNKPFLTVNGQDYPTFDGSCVRDYIHVLDIAQAHILAIEHMEQGDTYKVYNIGTGRGASVCEVVNKASEVLERIIPMESGPRRAGDPVTAVADTAKIREEWGFKPQFSDLETIIRTSWNMK